MVNSRENRSTRFAYTQKRENQELLYHSKKTSEWKGGFDKRALVFSMKIFCWQNQNSLRSSVLFIIHSLGIIAFGLLNDFLDKENVKHLIPLKKFFQHEHDFRVTYKP
jgi:hypothetical protein